MKFFLRYLRYLLVRSLIILSLVFGGNCFGMLNDLAGTNYLRDTERDTPYVDPIIGTHTTAPEPAPVAKPAETADKSAVELAEKAKTLAEEAVAALEKVGKMIKELQGEDGVSKDGVNSTAAKDANEKYKDASKKLTEAQKKIAEANKQLKASKVKLTALQKAKPKKKDQITKAQGAITAAEAEIKKYKPDTEEKHKKALDAIEPKIKARVTAAKMAEADDELPDPAYHAVEGTLTRTASSEITDLRKATENVNIPSACVGALGARRDVETGLDIVRNHISGDDLADPSTCSDSSIGSKDFYTAKGPKYNEKNLCGHMIYTYCPTFYSVYNGCDSLFSDWRDDLLPSAGVKFEDIDESAFTVSAVCPKTFSQSPDSTKINKPACKKECKERVENDLAFLNGDPASKNSIQFMLNETGVITSESLGTSLEHLITGGGLRACIAAMYKATIPTNGEGDVSLEQKSGRMTLDTAEVAHCESYHAMAQFGTDDFTNEVGDNEKISLDGKFRCVRPTAWTVDYESCKTLINTYDGAMATEQIGGVALQAADMVKQNEIQTEAMEKQAEGKGQTAAMDAMQQTAEYKSKQELGKSVFYGAQVATFTTMLGTYTTPSRIADKCNGGYWCARATGFYMPMYDSLKTEFFANQEVKNKFYQYIIETSGKAAVAGIMAANYKKQAEMVGEVKEEYVLPDYGNKGPRIQMSYCQFNPNAKGCRGSSERFKNGGGYEFGGFNGVGNTGDDLSVGGAEVADGIGEDKAMSAAERKKLDDLANLMGEGGGTKVKSGFKAPGAAKVSAGGGGGSAVTAEGASASGGGGGGGGGGAGVNNAGKSNMAARTGKVNFGQGGGLTFRGGKGSSSGRRTAKKSSNAYAKLFGKDKNRNVASGVNDIAPKNSSLFDKISKRYGIVKEEKRIGN